MVVVSVVVRSVWRLRKVKARWVDEAADTVGAVTG